MTAEETFVAMVKPITHGSGSHDALLAMLALEHFPSKRMPVGRKKMPEKQ